MVSEMIGESLKLAIVVTLVATFSLSAYSLLPEERVPHVEIQFEQNITNSSICLSHIGGDPLDMSEIKIAIQNNTAYEEKRVSGIWTFGEKIQIQTNLSNITEISVIHPRAILARYKMEG